MFVAGRYSTMIIIMVILIIILITIGTTGTVGCTRGGTSGGTSGGSGEQLEYMFKDGRTFTIMDKFRSVEKLIFVWNLTDLIMQGISSFYLPGLGSRDFNLDGIEGLNSPREIFHDIYG